MYDVIVIGAGPAGATAAKILAENGCRVLLAEKFKMPRYKSCSGQLIQKSLNLVMRYFGEPVPAYTTCSPAENHGMVFTDDTGCSFLFKQPGLNVWRSSFDAWLAGKAAEAGAVLQDGLSAVSCDMENFRNSSNPECREISGGQESAGSLEAFSEQKGSGRQNIFCAHESRLVRVLFRRADGSTCTETAPYVINCEGVTGVLKAQLTGRKQNCITTYQTFNRGSIDLDPHYFYAYLQPELSEYDAWFNVKDDRLVLGISVKNKEKERCYYSKFLHFMREKHGLKIECEEKADRWLLPQVSPGSAVCFGVGRVLFAGEAAGFLNPMGEGISAGMESAFCAANAILQYGEDTAAVYASYQESTKALHSYMKRQWSLVGEMAKTFSEMR